MIILSITLNLVFLANKGLSFFYDSVGSFNMMTQAVKAMNSNPTEATLNLRPEINEMNMNLGLDKYEI